jgi:hypothetical protein
LEFSEFITLAAQFLIEEDAEEMQNELKEAFRLYDKEGKMISSKQQSQSYFSCSRQLSSYLVKRAKSVCSKMSFRLVQVTVTSQRQRCARSCTSWTTNYHRKTWMESWPKSTKTDPEPLTSMVKIKFQEKILKAKKNIIKYIFSLQNSWK